MLLRVNRLKEMLQSGGVALSCNIHESRDSGVVHTIAASGAHSIFIDLEHNPQTSETAGDLIGHAHGAGITPLVRIPDLTYEWVTRLLDAGCQSLLVPHLRSPAEVERLLELARYHPGGRRGMAMYGGSGVNYQEVTDVAELTRWQNEHLLLGLVIETPEALEQLEDMLVPGIDFAIVGYNDLSHAYGLVGEMSHPRIVEAQRRVRDLCRERGIAYCMHPVRPEQLESCIAEGAQLLLYAGVLTYVRWAVKEAVALVDTGRSGSARPS